MRWSLFVSPWWGVCTLLAGAHPAGAQPAKAKPIAVVLPASASEGLTISSKDLETLWRSVNKALAARGVYRVVAHGKVAGRLRAGGAKATYARCFDRGCQSGLRRAFAADKALSPVIVGPHCGLTFLLWDLRRGAAERSASVRAGCSLSALLRAVKGGLATLSRSPAFAQQANRRCPAHMALVSGHCCWPGQRWHSRQGDCVGRPSRCPPGSRIGARGCHVPGRPKTIRRRAIIRGMNSAKRDVRACFRRHKRKGLAMVYVDIGSSGKVHGAEAKRRFSGTPTGACVAGVIKRLRFPASNKGARFMYPFLVK